VEALWEEVNFHSSPARFIAASEKLSIPAAIALPSNSSNGNTRVATYYAKGGKDPAQAAVNLTDAVEIPYEAI
jgi:hypothetical protein